LGVADGEESMLKSFPLVNEHGTPNGGEVTIKFMSLIGIETMTKYVYVPRPGIGEDRNVEDHYEVVPGCVVLDMGRTTYQVQADYEELKRLMAEFQWDE
jgi:hypothetical protein